jgi:hypothetical protein
MVVVMAALDRSSGLLSRLAVGAPFGWIVVVPSRARGGDQVRRRHAGDCLGRGGRLGPVQLGQGLVSESGRLVEELPHGDAGTAGVGEPELRQVLDDPVVEGQQARVGELEHRE